MDPFTIAMAGLSAYQAFSGQKAEKKQAGIQSRYLGQQIKGIDTALGKVGGVKSAQEQVVKTQYGMQQERLNVGQSEAQENIRSQYGQAVQQSGMATTAGAEEYQQRATKKAENQFSFQSEDLMSNLGQSLAGVEEWYSGEQDRLKSEKMSLEFQRRQAQEKKKGFYWGNTPGWG